MTPPASDRGRSRGGRIERGLLRFALIPLLLSGLTLAVFSPVLDHGFLELDDSTYVTGNSRVRQGLTRESVSWSFRSVGYAANWHPLTWLSHMLDVEVFGLDPRGHHLSSLLLHLLSAVVLGIALARMTGSLWESLLVSALFAVHPLHVESVAWIAERKDVLAGFFCMLTLFAYARYARAPNPGSFMLVMIPFALGLAAKQTLVTLPLMLLALDFWPLRRWRALPRTRPAFGTVNLLLEKLPLLGLSVVAGILTLVAQSRGGMVSTLETVTVPMRLANAALSAATYLRKTFWPTDLAFFYVFPKESVLLYGGASAALLLTAGTVLVIKSRARHPWLLTGWVWYAFGLLPVIGLVQVGQQSMADRYTYLPLIGIFVAAIWALGGMARTVRLSPAAVVAGATVLLLVASVAARAQVGFWRDGEALFERALAVTEGNWLAENNYGYYLDRKGKAADAEKHYRAALSHRPRFAQAHNNLGMSLVSQGKIRESLEHFRAAIDAMPDYEVAHYNLGSALLRLGSYGEALVYFREAVRLKPAYPEAAYSAGFILEMQGKHSEAAQYYRDALRFNPGHPRAQQGLSRLSRRGVSRQD